MPYHGRVEQGMGTNITAEYTKRAYPFSNLEMDKGVVTRGLLKMMIVFQQRRWKG